MAPFKGKRNQTRTSVKPKFKTIQKKQSQTSNRPVLKVNKPTKRKPLTKEDVALQEKITKKGLRNKGWIPKGNISLVEGQAKEFKKQNIKSVQKTKTKAIKKEAKKIAKIEDQPGIICLTNLPHGFYEAQLTKFFRQFGDLTNVRLVRSTETGRSCGYGYVEFRDAVVANIAGKTMDNYLTYGKIIKCRNLGYTKAKSNKIFGVEKFGPKNCPKVLSRKVAVKRLNATRTDQQIQNRERRVVTHFNKKLRQLKALGVKLDLKLVNENPMIEIKEKVRRKKPKKVITKKDTESEDVQKMETEEKTVKKKKTKKGIKKKDTEDVQKMETEGNTVKKMEAEEKTVQKKKTKKGKKKTKKGIKKKDTETEDGQKMETEVKTVKNMETKEKKVQKKKTKKGIKKKVTETEDFQKMETRGNTVKKMETEENTVKKKKTKKVIKKKDTETEEKTVVAFSKNDTSVSVDKKGEVVFEADESDDEITIKTPPFATKKLVRITPTSPATRVTDVATEKIKSAKKTPKRKNSLAKTLFKNTKTTSTPKQPAAVNKNALKKRRKSMLVAQENIKAKKQKRMSL